MRKRGKILREPRSGPGLLMIEGRQYWFGLEDIWKSGVAPKSALAVDVTLDDAGQILALTAVSESQLAEAERSVDTARELGSIRSPSKISAYCGQTEAALKMLRRTIEGNYCSYPAIDSDPLFANLRRKPEFAEIRSAAIECQHRFLAERNHYPQ